MKYLHSHPAAILGFLTSLIGWAVTNQAHLVAIAPAPVAGTVGGVITMAGAAAAMLGLSPFSKPNVPTMEASSSDGNHA